MGNMPTWHVQAVEQLSQLFMKEPEAKAFVLTGSLAAPEVQEDIWSDIDAKVILADHAVSHYYLSTAWLSPFGQLIGAERYGNNITRTLRVCLEGFQRFDLTFIAESRLRNPSLWNHNPFYPSYTIIWSRLSDLKAQIDALPLPAGYQDIPAEEIERMADEFWFKAAVAIAKVVRNDLLIALHLALDLARDSLVLQMIRRDQTKRTTIHRTGAWGNEIVTHFSWNGQEGSGEEILHLIKLSGEVFDELASALLPDYTQRGPLLFPTIEAAKQICYTRKKKAAGEL
jgi:hypothetical protein